MKIILYIVFLFCIASCAQQNEKDLLVFDVSSAFNHPETENSTNIIDSVDYYKLSDEYIVGDINRTHLYGDTICLVESDIISAFDMKNGKYLWQINNQGRGPQEYSSAFRASFMRNCIYIDGWNGDFKVYNLNGQYAKTLRIDSLVSTQELVQYIPDRLSYKDNMLVGYHFNRTGLESKMIIVIDENGNTVSSINRNEVIKKRKTMDIGGFGVLYKYDQDLYVWEQSNDTIFRVENGQLDPHVILSRDASHRVLCEDYRQSQANSFFLHSIKETTNYLIANAFKGDEDGVLLCDKRSMQVKFYQNSTLNQFESAIFKNAISDQYCNELVTFLYGYEYIDAKKSGVIPAELSNISITENSNPLMLKVRLK